MIKAVINVCPNYKSCFAQRTKLLESSGDSHCLECDLYRSYSFGFSDGVKQAVDAMTKVQPQFQTESLISRYQNDTMNGGYKNV